MRHFFVVLFGLLAAGTIFAQNPNAEVWLKDGSKVRMSILQESLDLQTKYGKLTIPLKDIRRIEFGLHLPEATEREIENAIKNLGSTLFKDREDATKRLAELGELAYPALKKAVSSKYGEVAKRAALALKKIEAKVAPELLCIKADDAIQTIEFTIKGLITSTVIKARSETFGEHEIKLSQMRRLHQHLHSGERELLIEAAQFCTNTDQWMDSGIYADPSLCLTIKADGQIDLWPQGPGQYMTTPKGYSTAGKGGVYMAGTLLGKIGPAGKVFIVGEKHEGIPATEGLLYFNIVPSPWNNASSGSYRVRIRSDFASALP